RFHDVPLSAYFSGHTLVVRWDLKSDSGLELGGWALDDVCIVANPNSICGDGVKTPTEGCDNGLDNADLPDKCRTYCHLPTCGDEIVDSNEECDDGKFGSPTCTTKCKAIDIGHPGCSCASSDGGGGSLLFGLLVFAKLARRDRKRE